MATVNFVMRIYSSMLEHWFYKPKVSGLNPDRCVNGLLNYTNLLSTTLVSLFHMFLMNGNCTNIVWF